MTTPDTATIDPRAQRGDELLAMLADRVGARFGTATVFGTAVQQDGVTVVPVARGRFVFGGGGGTDPDKEQSGSGGGAAGAMTPAAEATAPWMWRTTHPSRRRARRLAGSLGPLAEDPPATLVVVHERRALRREVDRAISAGSPSPSMNRIPAASMARSSSRSSAPAKERLIADSISGSGAVMAEPPSRERAGSDESGADREHPRALPDRHEPGSSRPSARCSRGAARIEASQPDTR
jgi:hypothetical protein